MVRHLSFGYIICKIKRLIGKMIYSGKMSYKNKDNYKTLCIQKKKGRNEMTEIFINVDELNDEDVAITITDEDGIFIDSLGDDLLSTSLQELEKKVSDLDYDLTYEDEEDLSYYIESFKDYLYQKNNPYACSGCGYMDDEDIKKLGKVDRRTFRGFIRKKF